MKLLNFTIIKLLFSLIIGICLAHFLEINLKIISYFVVLSLLILCVFWLKLKSKKDTTIYFGIVTYLCVISIGIFSYTIHYKSIDHYHYLKNHSNHNTLSIALKITAQLTSDKYNSKYVANIISINQKKTKGKLLVNIKKDSLSTLHIDDILFTKTQLKSIQKSLNPHQFNYQNYLSLKQVYHQIYITNNDFYKISNPAKSVFGYASKVRDTVNHKLVISGFDNETISIINALLLGQRKAIDTRVYTNYINSGTIHILAVSGLHVGILLWILNALFKPLLYIKNGRTLRAILILILLWAFAFLTGLSASVTRAVTMFSIISIGLHLKRSTNIYNTIIISAFIILLFKPALVFEIGFQMSYLAVLGIVSIQPILYKFWRPRYWVINKLWQIFTVTIAAQIGVLPMSLFYFHQFPGLFFVSNIVIIPFLGIILSFGILVITWSFFSTIPDFLVNIQSIIIKTLNTFIAWIATFDGFIIKNISFTLLQVICSYAFILFVIRAYTSKQFKWILGSLLGVIGFLCVELHHNYKNKNDAFIIFNKSRHTLIGEKKTDEFTIYHNLDTTQFKTDRVIKSYIIGEFIDGIKTDTLQSVYQFQSKTILVIDSLGIYKNLSFKPDYIVLRNSPKINLNRIIDNLSPKKIIADASNYKSHVNLWRSTCRYKKTPFHYTNEEGAFVLNF